MTDKTPNRKGSDMAPTDVNRIHERLNDISDQITELTGEVKTVAERCEPCSKLVAAHQATLHGNGKDGVMVELASLKTGKVDTLTIKSVVTLVGATGLLSRLRLLWQSQGPRPSLGMPAREMVRR